MSCEKCFIKTEFFVRMMLFLLTIQTRGIIQPLDIGSKTGNHGSIFRFSIHAFYQVLLNQ